MSGPETRIIKKSDESIEHARRRLQIPNIVFYKSSHLKNTIGADTPESHIPRIFQPRRKISAATFTRAGLPIMTAVDGTAFITSLNEGNYKDAALEVGLFLGYAAITLLATAIDNKMRKMNTLKRFQ